MTDPASGPNIFDAATRLDALDRAWDRVRANMGCSGGDGETIERFRLRAPRALILLSRELRTGRYRPGPLRLHDIPKPSGGLRRLAIPCVRDRVAQTAMADALAPVLEPRFEDESFAYRKGRGVRDAVAAVERHRRDGFEWIVDGDIARFFDTTPHDPLLAELEIALAGVPGGREAGALVALWLEMAALDLDTPGCGLPQGSPLSPLLANLHLDAVDEAVLARRGVRLVRYADDFLILARGRERAERAMTEIAEILEEHGLALNPEKSRVVSFARGVRFLGHLFVESMTLPSPNRDHDDGTQLLRTLAKADAAAATREKKRAESEADDRRGGLDAAARALYVLEPGRMVTTDHTCFRVTMTAEGVERDVLTLPHARIDRIEMGPRNRIDDAALRLALGFGIEVVFLTGRGETLGRAAPTADMRAALHLAQARAALNADLRTGLARRLVEGRIRNQRAALRRLNRTRKDAGAATAAGELTRVLRRLPLAPDHTALMGHEGAAGALYWPALGALIPAAAFEGEILRRRRDPPPDPFNAVVSYLAAMLGRDVATMARRAGLHPGFGVLHSARDRAEACVYDLMEPFRAGMTEAVAAHLFNRGGLDPLADFARVEDGGARLSGDARRIVIRAYETAAARGVRSPRSGKSVSWRGLMLEEARAYARHCESAGADPYVAYVMDY